MPERDSASSPLDAETVEALFRNHAQALRWFIRGIVRDPETAEDVLQTTFTRLIEHGGPDQTDPASRKSWLFQVAHHEAIAQKRKGRLRERANRDARVVRAADSGNQDTAEDHLQRAETIALGPPSRRGPAARPARRGTALVWPVARPSPPSPKPTACR